MCTGADAANAFNKCPGVSRIATFQDNLRAAPHGAGRHGVSNDIITVNIHFAAHMPFDASNRIDHNSPSAIVQRKTLSLIRICHNYFFSSGAFSDDVLFLLRACFMALTVA